jgi:hypothetical protein
MQLFGSPLDSNQPPLLVFSGHTQNRTRGNLNEFLVFVHSSETHRNTVPLQYHVASFVDLHR